MAQTETETIVPLPKRLKIGPYDYKVQPHVFDDGDYGECDCKKLVIRVDTSTAPGTVRDTIVHEALHALLDLVGFGKRLTEEAEEDLVRSLSPALLDLLRRNPSLVDFILER